MILGRASHEWLAALTAIFNLVVVFHMAGFDPSTIQIAAVDSTLAVVIALVANSAVTNALNTPTPTTTTTTTPSLTVNGTSGPAAL